MYHCISIIYLRGEKFTDICRYKNLLILIKLLKFLNYVINQSKKNISCEMSQEIIVG